MIAIAQKATKGPTKATLADIRSRLSSNPTIARRQLLDFLASSTMAMESKMILINRLVK